MQLCVCLDKKKKKKKRSSGGGRELQCCGGLAAMSSSMVCKVLLSFLIVYVAGGFRVAYVLSASSDDSSDSDAAFGFNQFSTNIGHVVLLGDAQVSNDDLALELTTTSAGRALFNTPVRLLDPTTETTVSFTTSFIFSIVSSNASSGGVVSYGDGLAFTIASDNSSVGSSGPWLGLLQASSSTLAGASESPQSRVLAVEFDTHQDMAFSDINDNHVGVDINSLTSVQSQAAQSGSLPVELASGGHIKAWIQYDSVTHSLDVWLSPYTSDYIKPSAPLLSVAIDLSPDLDEYMYVGFSASTGAGTVSHKVWSWDFQTQTLNSNGSPAAGSDDFGGAPSPSPGSFTGYEPPGYSGADKKSAKLYGFTTFIAATVCLTHLVLLLLSS